MKFESVIKQIISEQVTPNQVILKLLKTLGKKGAPEAESALIRAIRKEGNLGPKVAVDVNNVTEELMMRAVKNVEFASYRKLIAQKLYNKNQELYDDIILKLTGKKRIQQLNNAGIPPVFQEEVRNLNKLKKETIKQTPTTPSIPTLETYLSNPSSLWSTFRSELKKYKVTSNLSQSQGELFVEEIKGIIEKEYVKSNKKLEVTLENLKKVYDNLQPSQRKQFLDQAVKNVKSLGIKGNFSSETIEVLKNGITSVFSKNIGPKVAKNYIYLSTAISVLHDILRYYDDKENDAEFMGHFGLMGTGPTIAGKGLVLWISSHFPNFIVALIANAILVLDSAYRYWTEADIRASKNVKKPGTDPFESGTGNKDNEDVLSGIKNDN